MLITSNPQAIWEKNDIRDRTAATEVKEKTALNH